MDAERFFRELPKQWEEFPRSSHPLDRKLAPVLETVEGMATENKLRLLNFACSLLPREGLYMEVGTWKGATLVGALLGNSCRGIAIDDFSQFEGTRAAVETSLASFGLRDRVALIEGDYLAESVLAQLTPRSVDVYFYDGGHTYSDQFNALWRYERFLKDDAVVIVDDTSIGHVRRANRDFGFLHSNEWSLKFDIPSPYPKEPCWWNGVQVFHFKRRPGLRGITEAGTRACFVGGVAYNDLWRPRIQRVRSTVALRTRLRNLISNGRPSL
jgi:predicted O-methyltransferase YrrM